MLPVAREPTDEESEMSIAMKALQDRLKASAYYLTEPKKTGGNEKLNICAIAGQIPCGGIIF